MPSEELSKLLELEKQLNVSRLDLSNFALQMLEVQWTEYLKETSVETPIK